MWSISAFVVMVGVAVPTAHTELHAEPPEAVDILGTYKGMVYVLQWNIVSKRSI